MPEMRLQPSANLWQVVLWRPLCRTIFSSGTNVPVAGRPALSPAATDDTMMALSIFANHEEYREIRQDRRARSFPQSPMIWTR